MRVIYTPTPYSRLEEVFRELEIAPFVSIDTETVSTKNLKILVIGLAWKDGVRAFFSHDDEFLPRLLSILKEKDVVYHNALFDAEVFTRNFKFSPNILGDTMLLAQSLGYPAALHELSWLREFDFSYTPVANLIMKNGRKIPKATMRDADPMKLGEYCAEHAAGTYKVWQKLKRGAPRAYHLDFALIPRMQHMTKLGLRIDKDEVINLYRHYAPIVESKRVICEMLGFNPESGKQIAEQLQETGFYTGLTEKKNMRTDADSLTQIMDESIVAKSVLEYKEYSNMVGTFLKPRLGLSRVFPKYHIVRTGRFAGKTPNPQNIPKFLRSPYIPEEGHVWWDADAHQIEPTLQAYMSGDPEMIKAISTGDIYQPIADMFKIDRPTAKMVLLALSYGASAETLAEQSGLTVKDSADLIASVLKKFNVFAGWRIETQNFASEHGYIETLLGKKRSDMPPKDAVNSIVQGAGAIVLKLAMLRLVDFIISTTVHDEILVSSDIQPPATILENLIDIPLSWQWKTGLNWRDVK